MQPEPTITIRISDLIELQKTIDDAYNRLEELQDYLDSWYTRGIESIRSAQQTLEKWTHAFTPPPPTNTAPGDVAARDRL